MNHDPAIRRLAAPLILALLFSGGLLAGCASFGAEPDGADRRVSEGEPVSLSEGQTVRLRGSDFWVEFVERTLEARCPENVECFWEGEAEVELKAGAPQHEVPPFRIRGFLAGGDTTNYDVDPLGYRIRLIRLDPYPVYDQPERAPITLTLAIEVLD
ncbi:MAG: hypothetical protein R2834_22775 [Rhodothermales bacterium]